MRSPGSPCLASLSTPFLTTPTDQSHETNDASALLLSELEQGQTSKGCDLASRPAVIAKQIDQGDVSDHSLIADLRRLTGERELLEQEARDCTKDQQYYKDQVYKLERLEEDLLGLVGEAKLNAQQTRAMAQYEQEQAEVIMKQAEAMIKAAREEAVAARQLADNAGMQVEVAMEDAEFAHGDVEEARAEQARKECEIASAQGKLDRLSSEMQAVREKLGID